MENSKELLETTIETLKRLRECYESEAAIPEYDSAQHLAHPGDMLDCIHSTLAQLQRALRGVNIEATKTTHA